MGRLIDADALYEKLQKDSTYDLDFFDSELREAIETTPTAYDVDAVVERLMILHEEGYCPNEDDDECVLSKTCSDCYRDKLTEIIKRGGIE